MKLYTRFPGLLLPYKNVIIHLCIGEDTMGSGDNYIKYAYWLTETEDVRLQEDLANQNIRIKTTVGIPCAPLDPINKISRVTPEVWNGTCNRQGSWYRESDKNGLYLIVSSFELKEQRDRLASIISPSELYPSRFSSMKEKNRLLHEPEFMMRMPREWMDVSDREKKELLRWALKMGSKIKDFETLFITHSANHANFIKPYCYLVEQDHIIPCSIDRSSQLCSCCLELFQVIGGEYEKKYVSPCAGACIFARLEPDKYLLVKRKEE